MGGCLAACAALWLSASLPVLSADPRPAEGREGLNAVLWMQTAHEYAFLTAQVYAMATRALAQAKALPSALADPEAPVPAPDAPPALILDLDETVLETSRYGAGLITAGRWHREADWAAWVDQGQEGLVPGAVAFLRAARDQGYRIFYVSNRACPEAGRPEAYPHPACPQRDRTVALARRLGLPYAETPTAFLFRNDQAGWESGDKSPRRRFLAGTHQVAMLLGDDLGDFLSHPQLKALRAQRGEHRTISETILDEPWQARFGAQWFLLPNPFYGSWERALASCGDPDKEGPACYAERLEGKYRKLVPSAPALLPQE